MTPLKVVLMQHNILSSEKTLIQNLSKIKKINLMILTSKISQYRSKFILLDFLKQQKTFKKKMLKNSQKIC